MVIISHSLYYLYKGRTIEELYESLNEAMEGYLDIRIKQGFNISVPSKQSESSGKFVVRLPKILRQRLVIEAEQEGVSLNQYALYKLADS